MNAREKWKEYSTFQKSLAIFGVLVVVYSLTGFFLIPRILKGELKSRVKEQTGRELRLERVRLNPFALSATLEGVVLKEKERGDFAGFERFYANFQLSSLFRRSWTFAEIALEKPFGHLVIKPDGQWNFSDLMEKGPEPDPGSVKDEQKGGMPSVTVLNLHIDEGAVTFQDESKTEVFRESFAPLTISLANFTTHLEKEGTCHFKAGTRKGTLGKEISWQGTLSVNPFRSSGTFEIKQIHLNEIWNYIKEQVAFEIQTGRLDLAVDYTFSLSEGGPDFSLNNGRVALSGLDLGEKGNEEILIHVPDYRMEGITFDLGRQALNIDRIQLEKARIEPRIESDGRLNFERVFTPIASDDTGAPQEESSPEKADPGDKAFQLKIHHIDLKNNTVLFQDHSLKNPANIALEEINLEITDFTMPEKQRFATQLNANLLPQGSVTISGDVGLTPLDLALKLELNHLDLRPFQPYLNEEILVKVQRGNLDLNGDFTCKPNDENQPGINFKGDMALGDLETVDGVEKEKLITLHALKLKGVDLAISPLDLTIDSILLARPEIHLSRAEDGTLNVGQLLLTESKESIREEPQKAETPPEPTPATIAVNRLDIEGAGLTFRDNSVKPRYQMALSELNGSIHGISSDLAKKASINLEGKWDKYAPVKIGGKLNFLAEEPYSDLKLSLNDIGMAGFSPYSGTYIGREIEKGKLNLDISYFINKKKLQAENRLFLDQFTLGKRTGHPSATSLPVGLAIGLLKNSRGEIHLDLPIQGNLDDPEFKYGKMVWQTLGNLVKKTAASPFRLLADIVGSADDLSSVSFAPGQYELSPGNRSRLEDLARALNERRELQLEIKGTWEPSADGDAIKKMKLQQKLERAGGYTTPRDHLVLLLGLYEQNMGKEINLQILEELPEEKRVQAQIEALETELLKDEAVDRGDLTVLANNRAHAIRDGLESADLDGSRLFITGSEAAAPTQTGSIDTVLTLKSE